MAERSMNVECVLKAEATLGEGPVWCDRRQLLFWVDILAPAVHRFNPETREDKIIPMPSYAGAVALTQGDELVVALQHGLALVEPAYGNPRMQIELEPGQDWNRLNDGKCDANGRFWIGSMNLAERDATGCLYRIEGSWKAQRALDGLVISNGLGWSPDQKKMYLADSGAGIIFVFDFDLHEGRIIRKGAFVNSPPRGGVPDGLCVDADGCIWCAYWDGGCVARFTSAGKLDRIIELPVRRPTSVTFGGSDLRTLYVTSARCGLDSGCLTEQWPLSGNLFMIEGTGAQGLPTQRFSFR